MTQASEIPPAEQPAPRAVVYLYTQTGQLREVTEALTAPLVERGWDIRWVDVQPRVAFPFPWPIRRFFGVFPASVDPKALVELVEPAGWLRDRAGRIGDPGLPGVVSGALASHPVAAESAPRGLPGSEGRLGDRVPQHVVLGGDRGVRAVAIRRCPVGRGGRRDRHSAAGHNARDHPALAARPASADPFCGSAGRESAPTNSSGSLVWGDVSPSRSTVRRTRRPSCPPWRQRTSLRARCFGGGAQRSGRRGDSARWRRPRAW